MEDIDYLSALDGIPDDMTEFATPEDIHQLMSSDDWMSEMTGITEQSDETSVTALATRASGGMTTAHPSRPPAPSASIPAVRARQAPATLRNLSNTKCSFLRTIYELSKRDSEGIVSLNDIRNARAELAALNKTGKQGALHALVRTHHLVVYLKDYDPAMKSKSKLTPAGLSLCQKEFE